MAAVRLGWPVWFGGPSNHLARRPSLTFLLDVNVLIALIDPAHISHDAAHRWFEDQARTAWATCPLTENGVIRIVGHPKYPGAPGSPAAIAAILTQFRTRPGHVFWPDDISLLGDPRIDPAPLLTSGQVTELPLWYLL